MSVDSSEETTRGPNGPGKPRAFIVHGRDLGARAELDRCLTSLGLAVIPFEHIADRLAAMPVISDVLRQALADADVILVLFTPDEQAALFDPETGRFDGRDPGAARWQARANVIFEAGWAFGLRPDRTIFVSVGEVTAMFADVAGHHVIRLDAGGGKAQLRRRLAPLLPDRFSEKSDAWSSDPDTGDFASCARARWSFHDDLGELHAKLANMDLRGVNLLELLIAVNQTYPDWQWRYRVPRDLITALSRLVDPLTTDDAHWWLASIGFYRFSEIDDWGDSWSDSIDIMSFAPRSVVFLEWLRTATPPKARAAAVKRVRATTESRARDRATRRAARATTPASKARKQPRQATPVSRKGRGRPPG